MISLRSRRSIISLAFLHALLLAAAIETIPLVTSQSTLNHEKQLQLTSNIVVPADCHQTLWKRAVGAIPISRDLSDGTTHQEVARRAVGSVADSGKLCDPILPLKSASRLRARSNPSSMPIVSIDIVVDTDVPPAASMHLLHKRSSRKPTSPPVIKSGAKKTVQSPTGQAGKPQAESKYSRAAAW